MDRIIRLARACIASASCALVLIAASDARGDPADAIGAIDPTLERDTRPRSIVPERARSPSGFLYEQPYRFPDVLPLAGGWSYRLSGELGILTSHGPDRAARLHGYRDYRDGFAVNYFSFAMEQGAEARYFDVTAGAVGRKDQHFRAALGRYGEFRASGYFSQLPRSFTDQARTVFEGAGSANLTLPAGLIPGNNSPAQIASALQSATPFDLGFVRRKSGLEIEATPNAHWRLYARYGQERTNGTRPLGSAGSFPGVPTTELVEPIAYKTHSVTAGAQWASEALQANVSYTGSFFRNAVDTLTWENPLRVDVVDFPVLRRGRIDLYPDNDFHNLKIDLSAALPMRGRVRGGLSWSRMSQDDPLIGPVANSGILGGVDLANWNTTDALSKKSAGARIDNRMIHVSSLVSPVQDLTLQASFRRDEEDNKTRYTAFNPLTGQFGYLGLDGAVNNLVPAFSRVQVQSVPFEYRKDRYAVEGDYRFLRRTNVVLGYERETIKGRLREVGRTEEDRLRVALNNRDLPWATLRLSFEQARRSGDRYDFDANRLYYSTVSLANWPATLAQLRKHDVADRNQQIANARINFLVREDMDLAISGRYLRNRYGAAYGRLGERTSALNLEWSWQPGTRASAYAHYGFQRSRNRMAQISDDPAGFGTGDPNAGGAVYPLANRWEEDSRDDAHSFGFGFRHAFSRVILESGYAWMYSPYRTRYGFASGGALVGGAAAAAGAGEGMPDIVFRQQTLESSLRITIDRNVSLRLYHRYERARFSDWHYDALPLVFANGAGVFLGAGAPNYSSHLFGIFIQYAPGAARDRGS